MSRVLVQLTSNEIFTDRVHWVRENDLRLLHVGIKWLGGRYPTKWMPQNTWGGVCVCVVCVRESMCVCVVVVGEHSMLLHYYNYQGLTLHIKWSINGGWEICDVRIRLIIHSFVFSQHCQWTPFYKPKHRSMVRRYNLS